MKVLVVLIAALAWPNMLNVEGNLMQQPEPTDGPRGFFPAPYYPPFQPTFSPGVYPVNVRPECFPQPPASGVASSDSYDCPVCPPAEKCTCEPVLPACQSYTITVCPSAPATTKESIPKTIKEVIEEKIVNVETGQVLAGKQEVVDITPEFVANPAMYGPMRGYTPYSGFNQLIGGLYPTFPGFSSQFGATNPELVSALRSLADQDEGKSEIPKTS